MKRWTPVVLVATSLAALAAGATGKMALTSKDLKDGGTMPDKQVFSGMGCKGENISPELSWAHPPEGTKSFVVTAYDPDAPTGSGWWHWVVYNIPATTMSLPANASASQSELPAGVVQGKTDFGAAGYGGACPPPGDKPHRYLFTVYALKVDKLDLPADASAAYVGYMTHANSLGSATLTVKYARPKEK